MPPFIFKILVVTLFVSLVAYTTIWQIRLAVNQWTYELFHKNEAVDDYKKVDEILGSFERIRVDKLEDKYAKDTWIKSQEYSKAYSGAVFYIVDRKDIYQTIAGQARIKDLLSKDAQFRRSLLYDFKKIYWRIDKKILYKIIDLRKELEKAGHDKNAFKINSAYRTPKHNKRVGGAPKSRHIWGQAVDLRVSDVNKDGRYTKEDKQIILDILEHKVIKNQGGIGRYPGSRAVHMDVRGYRARWDSY